MGSFLFYLFLGDTSIDILDPATPSWPQHTPSPPTEPSVPVPVPFRVRDQGLGIKTEHLETAPLHGTPLVDIPDELYQSCLL